MLSFAERLSHPLGFKSYMHFTSLHVLSYCAQLFSLEKSGSKGVVSSKTPHMAEVGAQRGTEPEPELKWERKVNIYNLGENTSYYLVPLSPSAPQTLAISCFSHWKLVSSLTKRWHDMLQTQIPGNPPTKQQDLLSNCLMKVSINKPVSTPRAVLEIILPMLKCATFVLAVE